MTMLLLRLALVNRRRTAPGPRLLAEENRERLKTVVEAQIGSLPDDHLLDAAHIMADSHELLGRRSSTTASRCRRWIHHGGV